MAKCPQCRSRKGKRDCPALQAEICSVCCGDGRLRTIRCPSECPYLESEHYQKKRRNERAKSQGREFLEGMESLFSSEEEAEFAFNLQADVYYFIRRKMPVDDEAIGEAFDSLRDAFSAVIVPQNNPHPLARFLRERIQDGRRYPRSSGPSAEDRSHICRDLARHVAALRKGGGSYGKVLSSFFDELDFEADLDYSPDDPVEAEGDAGGSLPTSPGGLILPFSGGS